MTRWLVTGAAGMLGHDLLGQLRGRDVVAATRADLDITDVSAVEEALRGVDVVLNAAAWTDVDGAEAAEKEAAAVNVDGARLLAQACRRQGTRLVHISTDYVFGGDQSADPSAAPGWLEDAPPGPRSAYGRTKLAGERAVLAEGPRDAYVVRTAWLYGEHGRNFVRTMITLESGRPTVDVVDDQWGQPTWTRDLANRLVSLAESDAVPGIYHVASAGRTTWCGLAKAVFAALGADPERVRPTTSDVFVRPAPRPAFSVLGGARLADAGLEPMPRWEVALAEAMPSLTARETPAGP